MVSVQFHKNLQGHHFVGPSFCSGWAKKFLLITAFKKLYCQIYCCFHFLKGRYFLMGAYIFMNVSAFLETSVGFLKSAVLQLFPKYSQSYAYLNVKVGQKIGRFFSVSHLDVTCKTL